MTSDLLGDLLSFRLWVTSRSLERGAEIHLQSLGLTFQTALILTMAGEQGLCRPKDIAEKVSLSAAAVSRMLRTLEDRGLVEIQTRLSDRRESKVTLTPEGEALRTRARQILVTKAGQLRDQMSNDEFATIQTALSKVSLARLRDVS